MGTDDHRQQKRSVFYGPEGVDGRRRPISPPLFSFPSGVCIMVRGTERENRGQPWLEGKKVYSISDLKSISQLHQRSFKIADKKALKY